jgi:hypothetical protein
MQIRFKVALLGVMLCACGSTDSAAPGNEPGAFVSLCQRGGLACNADSERNAPNLLGAYMGTGQTVGTTSSLWEVGDVNTFDAMITQQTGDTVDGTFDMGSLHLDIKSGQLRGSAQSFTVFGTDTVSQTNCNTEVIAAIVGTRQAGGTLTGKLALEFTKNISGSGCTADQLSGYPGTGAVFSYTATANQ